jgi:UDP-N-acetylglucosamine kinase
MEFNYRRYYLDEQRSEEIFQNEIVPHELVSAVPGLGQPVAIFIAGQPGAGKTDLTAGVVESLSTKGGCVQINSDTFKPYHPMWNQLLEQDDTTAAPYTAADGRRWMAKAEQYAIEQRMNVVIETTMRDPGVFVEPLARLAAASYRTELVVLAVPAAISRLGILSRYEEQVRQSGSGRLTEVTNHNACYEAVANGVAEQDATPSVDGISIWRRGGEALYVNVREANHTWAAPPAGHVVLTAARQRVLTYPEATMALHEVKALADSGQPVVRAQVVEVLELLQPLLPRDAVKTASVAEEFRLPMVEVPATRGAAAARYRHFSTSRGEDPGIER